MLFMTCAILWCMLHGGQIMVSFDSDLHCYEAPPSKAAISRHFSPRWLPCAKTAVILWFQSAGHFRISNFWRSIYKFHLLSNFACLFHVYIISNTFFFQLRTSPARLNYHNSKVLKKENISMERTLTRNKGDGCWHILQDLPQAEQAVGWCGCRGVGGQEDLGQGSVLVWFINSVKRVHELQLRN